MGDLTNWRKIYPDLPEAEAAAFAEIAQRERHRQGLDHHNDEDEGDWKLGGSGP